ncbi:MAG TPA: ParA family protein [Microvirga sp.]|nr:ParA family protein [Microvirga sp.]
MRVLSLVTQKGGTGKSTLAVSLGVAAQESGLKVCVLDTDPQGTASSWSLRRSSSIPGVEAAASRPLSPCIGTLAREGYDLVIVDTPSVSAGNACAAMQAGDLCLIPVRPSIADVEAARPTVQFLVAREKAFAFVLNQCPGGGRTSRTTSAFRGLEVIGCVCEPTVALRTDHVDALAFGRGVTEHARTSKAAAETRAVLDWALARMQGRASALLGLRGR